MKHRYIVRIYVEAKSPQEALKLAKGITPHEAYLDDRVWEKLGYPLTEADKSKLGFKADMSGPPHHAFHGFIDP